jgi:Multiubiquitin
MSENHEADIAIHMDKQTFEVHQVSMTGTQLRSLPTPPIGNDRNLWLEVPGGNDEKIADDQVVQLHNGQHFFTTPTEINPGR